MAIMISQYISNTYSSYLQFHFNPLVVSGVDCTNSIPPIGTRTRTRTRTRGRTDVKQYTFHLLRSEGTKTPIYTSRMQKTCTDIKKITHTHRNVDSRQMYSHPSIYTHTHTHTQANTHTHARNYPHVRTTRAHTHSSLSPAKHHHQSPSPPSCLPSTETRWVAINVSFPADKTEQGPRKSISCRPTGSKRQHSGEEQRW